MFSLSSYIKFVSFIFLSLIASPLFSEEIILWHAFEGFIQEKFEELIEDYNQLPDSRVKVKASKNGNYTEVYERGLNAIKEGNPPDILQVYEVATLNMMQLEKDILPVGDLFDQLDYDFYKDDFIDAAVKFYSDPQGRMLSLPWNASAGVLFYNKQVFKAMNIDPIEALSSWEGIEAIENKFVQNKMTGFSTA
jgi:sn-glycerol 3-phosphate transport system substrate-binding protein